MGPVLQTGFEKIWQVEKWRTKDLGRPPSKWFVWDKGILPLWSQFSFCNKKSFIPKICTASLVSWDSIWNTGDKKKPGSPRFCFWQEEKRHQWVPVRSLRIELMAELGWKVSIFGTLEDIFIRIWSYHQPSFPLKADLSLGDAEMMRRYIGVHSIHRKNHFRPIHYLGWLVVRT